jgi:hypothetical protein
MYVAAVVETLKEKERRDETQFIHQNCCKNYLGRSYIVL